MLLGRDLERRAVDDVLAAARVARSGALVLTGEAGVGKTSLLEEAADHAGGMRVLRAQGLESEQAVGFAGLLQLLGPVLPLLGDLPRVQARALASALLLADPWPGPAVEPHRFAVGAATLALLSRAAEDRPLVVIVDDAHLLDRPSADAVVFAARRLFSDPVALLAATRVDEPGSQTWAHLPTLGLGGLDLADATELLRAAAGPDRRPPTAPEIGTLHRTTAGNPLALLELGAHLDRLVGLPEDSPVHVSAAVSSAFLGHFDDLDDGTRLALVVAAADGASLGTVHRACTVLGLGRDPLARAEDAGLVRTVEDRVVFRHPLLRSAIYGSAPAATRRRVHRALAGVVAREPLDRFAWHLAQGAVPPDAATARVLDAVAVRASARGAHETATTAAERAARLSLDPPSVARRLATAGEAAWLAGMTERATDLLDEALGLAQEPALRSAARESRAGVEFRSGSLDRALSMLVGAADEAADPVREVRLLSDAIHVCFYLGDAPAALSLGVRVETLLGGVRDRRTIFLGTMSVGMALVLEGSRGREGAHRIREALELATEADAPEPDPFRLPHRVLASLYLREVGGARLLLDATVARLREEAALGALPYLLMHLARDDATTHRWDDAEASYAEGIRLASETGQTTDRAVSQAGLAWLLARQGREEECRSLVGPTAELCAQRRIGLGAAWLDFAQGDLAVGTGDLDAAVDHYQRLLDRLAGAGLCDPDASPAPELVEVLVSLGRTDRAAEVLAGLSGPATVKGQPWSLARLERARGLVAAGQASGPPPEALTHFARALEHHARTPDRYEAARTQLAYGAALRRARRRVDARPLLAESLAAFESLGAQPWADRAALELEATGQTAQRREVGEVERLTPQERQVARLLAQGRTTREAAAALFLSPKTVEYHLRHVYQKLGLNSREALAEVLGE